MSFLTTKPVQIIKFTTKWVIDTASLKTISNSSKPMKVLCIDGIYRKGKSTFLNYILGVEKNGFAIGNEVSGKTKGIWMWIKEEQDHFLVVLDTEGLYDTENDSDFDLQLLTLTMLLSSYLIINTASTLETNVLHDCYAASKMTENIYGPNNDIEKNSPMMLFLIRDFYLKLKDGESPQDYMMRVLSTKDKDSDLKKLMERFDGKLFCETLVTPTVCNDDIGLIDTNPEIVKTEFKSKIDQLVKMINDSIPLKKIYQGNECLELNAGNFQKVLESFIDGIHTCMVGNGMTSSKFLKIEKLFDEKKMELKLKGFNQSLSTHRKKCCNPIQIPIEITNLKIFSVTQEKEIFSFVEYFPLEEELQKENQFRDKSKLKEFQYKCKEIYTQKFEAFNVILGTKSKDIKRNLINSINSNSNLMKVSLDDITYSIPQTITGMKKTDFKTIRDLEKEKRTQVDKLNTEWFHDTLVSYLYQEIRKMKLEIDKFDEFGYLECQNEFKKLIVELCNEIISRVSISKKEIDNKKMMKLHDFSSKLLRMNVLEQQFDLSESQRIAAEMEKKRLELIRKQQQEEEERKKKEAERQKQLEIAQQKLEAQKRQQEAEELARKKAIEDMKRQQEIERKELEEAQREKERRFLGGHLEGTWRYQHPRRGNQICKISFSNSKIHGSEVCPWSVSMGGTTGTGTRTGKRGTRSVTMKILNDNQFTMTFVTHRGHSRVLTYSRC